MARKTAPLPEAKTGALITVGGFNGKPSRLLEITITDSFRTLAMGGDKRVYDLCGMCDNHSGFRSGYAHVMGGICFHCNGGGIHSLYAETLEDAQKKVRRATARRNTEARKQEERMAKVAEEKAEYRALNAGQIDRVTAWLESRNLLEPMFIWDGNDDTYHAAQQTYDNARGDWYDRRDASVDGYAINLISDILNSVEYADAKKRPNAERWATCEKFMRQFEGKEEARRAEQESSRYAGEEGEKITITGKIIAAFDADTTFGFKTVYRTGYIIKGTGDYAGITLKWIASGAGQYKVDKGTEGTFTGKVKELSEYKGVKQTVVNYVKVS